MGLINTGTRRKNQGTRARGHAGHEGMQERAPIFANNDVNKYRQLLKNKNRNNVRPEYE